MSSGKKILLGLLRNNCAYATPVYANSHFIKNILTLSKSNPEVETLIPAPDFLSRLEKKNFTIPEEMKMHQTPIILPLFSNHKIAQGHISDPNVLQSIQDYYSIAKFGPKQHCINQQNQE